MTIDEMLLRRDEFAKIIAAGVYLDSGREWLLTECGISSAQRAAEYVANATNLLIAELDKEQS